MSTDERTNLETERAAMDALAAEENAKRTGKGLRVKVSATRGKNTMNISYNAWDTSQPSSLPETVAEFVQLSGVTEESELVRRLIEGDNDIRYQVASDPIAEFVSPSWPDALAASFKQTVKTLVNGGIPLDRAVSLVKPGIETAAGVLASA